MNDWRALDASIDRQLAMARAGLRRALLEAEDSDRSLLSSGGMVERVAGGDRSSVVESAALGRVSNRERARLWRAAQKVERAAAEWAGLVVSMGSPVVRNDPKTGRVVAACSNPLPCPSSADASKDGLCEACWWHAREHPGRHRSAVDVRSQRLERLRKDRERKRLAG